MGHVMVTGAAYKQAAQHFHSTFDYKANSVAPGIGMLRARPNSSEKKVLLKQVWAPGSPQNIATYS